jgi:DNA-binding MarR family transcriptional regulator
MYRAYVKSKITHVSLPTCSLDEKLQQVGATLTGVLDRIEERGVIRRERDRLIWRIWLTDAGRELKFYHQLPYKGESKLCKEILPGERQLLSQLVDQAIANLS